MLSGIKYNLAVIALLCMACSAAWGQKQSAGTPYGWHTPGLRKAVTIPYLKLPVDTTRKTVDKRLRRCYAGNVGVLNADVVKQGLHITTDSLDIWKLGIYSKDAESISLIFSSFDIDQKSGVYLYTPDKSLLHGKYGADNVRKGKSLPVSPIAGDSVIVEYQVPKGDKTGLLVIGDAAHNFKSTAGFNTSNNCSPHSNTQEALSEIERATCHLYICDRSSSWFCTGSMINSELHKPYIYTAGHCYSGNYYNADVLAERTVVTFNYEVPARDTLIQGSEECSIAGTTLRIYNESLDCTLLEMDSMPPKDYRPYLAGWNRNTPQEGVYTCIQHPNGDSKRVSYTSRPTIASFSSSFVSDGFWKVEEWDTGTTEEGSSGSGLLDPQLRIIGALTGGQSYCDSPYKDYYSRFDIAWDYARGSTGQLKYWLSPESELTQMDGFDPYTERNVCERVCNLPDDVIPTSLYMPERKDGYLCGHNRQRINQYAERYEFDTEKTLYGVYLMIGTGYYEERCPINIHVYADDHGLPGNLLRSTLFAPIYHENYRGNVTEFYKGSYTAKENYVRFDSPIQIGTACHIAFELDYNGLSARDSFHILAAPTANSTASWLNGSEWASFDDSPYTDLGVQLWIEPVVSDKDLTAVHETTDSPRTTISIYPNPTRGTVYLRSQGTNCSYRLYDLAGRLVLSGTGTSLEPPTRPGVYLLTIDSSAGTISHKLIVLE